MKIYGRLTADEVLQHLNDDMKGDYKSYLGRAKKPGDGDMKRAIVLGTSLVFLHGLTLGELGVSFADAQRLEGEALS